MKATTRGVRTWQTGTYPRHVIRVIRTRTCDVYIYTRLCRFYPFYCSFSPRLILGLQNLCFAPFEVVFKRFLLIVIARGARRKFPIAIDTPRTDARTRRKKGKKKKKLSFECFVMPKVGKKKSFYGVARGREGPKVYSSWEEVRFGLIFGLVRLGPTSLFYHVRAHA